MCIPRHIYLTCDLMDCARMSTLKLLHFKNYKERRNQMQTHAVTSKNSFTLHATILCHCIESSRIIVVVVYYVASFHFTIDL